MPGPICIFRPDDPRSSDLRELFTSDIQYHKVVVISIAGRYRQGKSFLLNFMIRCVNFCISTGSNSIGINLAAVFRMKL